MDFEQALTQELKTIAAFGGRVYPLTSPEANAEGGVPYLVYGSSEGQRTKTVGGYQSEKTVRGEVNVIAARYADMKAIMSEVIEKMISMEQRAIGAGGPFIQEFTYSDPVEMYESAPNLYRSTFDFEVYF